MIMNSDIDLYIDNYVQVSKRWYVKLVRRCKCPQMPSKQVEIDEGLFPDMYWISRPQCRCREMIVIDTNENEYAMETRKPGRES